MDKSVESGVLSRCTNHTVKLILHLGFAQVFHNEGRQWYIPDIAYPDAPRFDTCSCYRLTIITVSLRTLGKCQNNPGPCLLTDKSILNGLWILTGVSFPANKEGTCLLTRAPSIWGIETCLATPVLVVYWWS